MQVLEVSLFLLLHVTEEHIDGFLHLFLVRVGMHVLVVMWFRCLARLGLECRPQEPSEVSEVHLENLHNPGYTLVKKGYPNKCFVFVQISQLNLYYPDIPNVLLF